MRSRNGVYITLFDACLGEPITLTQSDVPVDHGLVRAFVFF